MSPLVLAPAPTSVQYSEFRDRLEIHWATQLRTSWAFCRLTPVSELELSLKEICELKGSSEKRLESCFLIVHRLPHF